MTDAAPSLSAQLQQFAMLEKMMAFTSAGEPKLRQDMMGHIRNAAILYEAVAFIDLAEGRLADLEARVRVLEGDLR